MQQNTQPAIEICPMI